jgi:hypothetical protein
VCDSIPPVFRIPPPYDATWPGGNSKIPSEAGISSAGGPPKIGLYVVVGNHPMAEFVRFDAVVGIIPGTGIICAIPRAVPAVGATSEVAC